MSFRKRVIPGFISDRYFDFKRRLDKLELSVKCLETTLDGLIVKPKYAPGEDVGFNGQLCRKRIFQDLCAVVPFDAAVETGTWLGDTTGYIAESMRKPVYSCEVNARFHAVATRRLADPENVQLALCDFRSFLRKLADTELIKKCVFFYLDAHWYDDLPLVAEIELVASHWRRWVVMIDDFKVSDYQGYGYDIYGGNRALDLNLIEGPMSKHKCAVYFPAAPASEESGPKRGCVVLAPGEIPAALTNLQSLRAWTSC